MNETGNIIPPQQVEPAYKDRSTGLMVFGILTLLMGCLVGLFVPLMLFGQMMTAKAPNAPPTNPVAIAPAVVDLWLPGRGVDLAGHWFYQGAALGAGVIAHLFLELAGDRNHHDGGHAILHGQGDVELAGQYAERPAGDASGGHHRNDCFHGSVLCLFLVVVPALWTFFYGSRHVKATCETRDPVTRWTDACPLPVLGFSLWTWLAVPMMLVMPLTGRAVMPFFGMFLSGLPGGLFCLLIAAVWGMAGWWLYRLDARGWWLILIALVVFLLSALLTYAHHDIIEMYQLQGLPQAQIDQIQKMGLFTGNRMGWFTALFTLPLLGYLLFIKRYLRKT